MTLTITQGGKVIAELYQYDGPIPRIGEHWAIPPMPPRRAAYEALVKRVTYHVMARTNVDGRNNSEERGRLTESHAHAVVVEV
jgi:hypothetical protein